MVTPSRAGIVQISWLCRRPKKTRGGQAKRVSRGSVLDPFCVAPLVRHTTKNQINDGIFEKKKNIFLALYSYQLSQKQDTPKQQQNNVVEKKSSKQEET